MIPMSFEGTLKYKVGGIGGGGAWTDLNTTRDVTLNLEAGEADVTHRGGGGFVMTQAALMDSSVEFDMVWDPADVGVQAIRDAHLNRSVIGIQCLDDSGEGLQADMQVFEFSRNEAITDAMIMTVRVRPTYSATAPSWIP
jgi:hypothetical protein